ncbi:MAG: hypothetical protein ACFB0E_03365 [Leptolyngbyaceae cyanobacterium]|mgnify:CR=1 FL=1
MIGAQFFAEGMKLVVPVRSQTDTNGSAIIQLQNPNQRWLLSSYALKGSGRSEHCTDSAQITCSLPTSGSYEVSLFGSDDPYGSFGYVGQVEFNRR